MSYIGAVGQIMEGSGLQDTLEMIYAPNTVLQIISGKAYSRAIRGHILTDWALNTLLFTELYGTEDGADSADTEKIFSASDELMEFFTVYLGALEGHTDMRSIEENLSLAEVAKKFSSLKQSLSEKSRTAKLWIQYMEMIDILKKFIQAERTGNWDLHLQAVEAMLPYFAASNHFLYAKSARVYLQNMKQLETTNPDVFDNFQNGSHVIRRSEKFWAGLSSDLVIEQVLMRSLKTNGGLTRGSGMSELQRLTWLLSAPTCSAINSSMQTFAKVQYETSEQHKEVRESRIERDNHDTSKLLCFLAENTPFAEDPSLRNITSGVTADEKVNVDTARSVGQEIMDSMTGENVNTYTFKKKSVAVTLANKAAPVIDGQSVAVDPAFMFQRLVTVAGNSEDDLESYFKYELCSPPPSLFEANGLPRTADKPALADAMWRLVAEQQPKTEDFVKDFSDKHIVLDGGALLQRIPWEKNSTYDSICQKYVDYVARKYGAQRTSVVFDGYDQAPSIKDITHLRRKGKRSCPQINFSRNMVCSTKKEVFLSNFKNKQAIIAMTSEYLTKAGCQVYQAEGDADLLIVLTAVRSASLMPTVLVGDDTDLLILLCYHAQTDSQAIYFYSEPRAEISKNRIWDINATKLKLGSRICSTILYVHAFLGCDSTSRVYGIGKSAGLQLLIKNNEFYESAKVFMDPLSTKHDISAAGEKAMMLLFKCPGSISTLNQLRHLKFIEKVTASASYVESKVLPPTSDACSFHSFRVYLQVESWKTLGCNLDPGQFGWVIQNGLYRPIFGELPAAPNSLLAVFRCNCKTDCSNMRCTCKRNGMKCTWACGACKGTSCANCVTTEFLGVDDLEDNEDL